MDSPYPNRDRADQLMNDSRKWAIRLFVVGAINLILQAALLAVSLVSIADDSDLVPAPYAIAAAVGGLVLLTVSAFGALHLRLQRGNTQRSVQR